MSVVRALPGAALFLAGLGGVDTARAEDVLLGERARHPLTALIGIPNAAARTLDRTLTVRLLHGNAFMGGTAGDETLLLDGESTDLMLGWQQPFGTCKSVSVRVPLRSHQGGSFDSAIETWHDWFGLPNGGREDAPRNQLDFSYVVGDTVYELDSATGGFGDVSLWLGGSLGCATADTAIPWRVGIKLPTGDPDRWLGSGGTDLWADLQSRVFKPTEAVRVAASVGLLLPGQTDTLPTLESVAVFGSVGLQLRLTPRLGAHAAIDWNTALFDSQLVELGDPAAQLTTGLRYQATTRTRVDIQITEDVLIDTATDIALRIAISSAL